MRRIAVAVLFFLFIFAAIVMPMTAFSGAQESRVAASDTRTERAQMTLDAGALNGALHLRPASPEAPDGATVVVTEDFEGAFPTGAWSAPAGTQSCSWGSTDAFADASTFSASPVGAGCDPAVNPLTGPLPANAQIAMIYGPFDLSAATSAEMSFRHAQQLESAGGAQDRLFYGHIDAADCVGGFTGNAVYGGDFSWQSRTLDMSSRAGSSTVCVAFILVTDSTAAVGDEGVFIDNVSITYDDTPTTADLALTLIDVPDGAYLPGGNIVIHNITENVGTETSNPYDIDFYASLDMTITAADEHLGGFPSNPPIGPGGIDDFFDTLTLPKDLMPLGPWFIGGIVTVVDADPNNNTNHDATPILVSTDPDIDIRPLSLDFDEAAMMEAPLEAMAQDDWTAAGNKEQVLPELRARAADQGRVHLIVGLDARFVPQGYLSRGQAQDQRAAFRAAGQQLMNDLAGLNVTLRRQFDLIPYLAVTADLVALDRLAASPLVRSLGEDRMLRPSLASSSLVIGSPLAWAEGYDGSGWAVAVLDTGVDHTHDWFASKLASEACYGTNMVDEIESFCPGMATSSTAPNSGLHCDLAVTGCDHGTHVAGIAVGEDGVGPDFGVARGADLIAIQVFSKVLTEAACGVGEAPCLRALDTDVIAGLERVAILAATIDIAAANMSLGGGSFADQASCDASAGADAWKAAIDTLRSMDIASLAAAGNDGYVGEIGRPGCISTAISVGATTDSDQVAVFSNIYPQIHLLAPGVSIDSSVPGNMVAGKSGTSMATPQVAGAWAVMKQRDPAATVTEVLTALQNTATPVDDQRVGGIEMAMPRINLDLALGEPRTTFGIFNDGPGPLNVLSITPDMAAPWIGISPAPPYALNPLELQVVSVNVDFSMAPKGTTQTRLLINSDDPDESPYPGGVFVNVTTSGEPAPEFDSDPAAGATLAFPDTVVNESSGPLAVAVSNLGGANLTLACGLSGAHSSQFAITACPTPIAPAGAGNIMVTCSPTSTGAKTASLDVTTNDADEADVTYDLSCTGIEAGGDLIDKDGFESAP